MKMLTIFSIYDQKADAFIQPWFLPNTATGIRAFSDAANDPETNMCKHPEDYTLFELGTFDPSKGKIKLHKVPLSLGLALTMQRPIADLMTANSDTIQSLQEKYTREETHPLAEQN